jgi:hypothetical protein
MSGLSRSRIATLLVLLVPASAFAGNTVVAISEPSLISLVAAGGIALALYGKLRKK